MLCQFSFNNFKSYRSETVLDFQAEALPEFRESLLDAEKTSALLPVSVVYGPNGGGKSNLLQALGCLVTTVVRPIFELKKNRIDLVVQQRTEAKPFLLDKESRKEPTEFEIYFRTNGNEYRYYLALRNDEVISEYLFWRSSGGGPTGTLFSREKTEIELGSSIRRAGINKLVNPKMPYLSFLAINYNIPAISEVQRWFESCIIQSYAVPEIDRRVLMLDDLESKRMILRALNDLGIDIQDYRYNAEEMRLYTERSIDGTLFALPIEEESDGTRKLLAVLPLLMIALKEGRLVVLDELDAKLHPKLLRYIIRMFKKKELNQKGAQLLFTSHDMSTMRNTVFRRDEIWFAALGDKHGSEIYSLYDLRNPDDSHVSNKSAYDKQYLEGRYGADPYLQNMLEGGAFA